MSHALAVLLTAGKIDFFLSFFFWLLTQLLSSVLNFPALSFVMASIHRLSPAVHYFLMHCFFQPLIFPLPLKRASWSVPPIFDV